MQAVVSKAASAKFVNFPNTPDCITGAVESGDPEHGPSMLLAKFAPGCAAPWHFHTPNEQVMLINGALQVQMKDGQPVLMHRGDFVLAPSHHIHMAKCTGAAPCLMFLYSDAAFDIHYVDAAGAEIPLGDALKAPSTVKTAVESGK